MPNMKTLLWKIVCGSIVLTTLSYAAWLLWQNAHPGLRHYNLGVEYAAANQIEKAESEWQAGIREDPRYPGNYQKLGELYENGRNYTSAADKYTFASKLSPRNGRLLLRLAKVQLKLKDIPAAAASARRAAEIMPYDPEALSIYADLAQQINDMPRAEVAISRLHYLYPRDTAVLFRLVRFDLAKMDMSAFERDLMPYMQTHKDDPEGCYLMEILLDSKPRTPESIQAGIGFGERAVASSSNEPESAILLGKFYLDDKQTKVALKTYLAAARTHPNNEAILQGIVECYNRLFRHDQAEKTAARLSLINARHERMNHLKRKLNINHADMEAGLDLPKLEEEDGDLTSAHLDYVRILNQIPDELRVHAALSAFYQRSGQSNLATKALDLDYREDSR